MKRALGFALALMVVVPALACGGAPPQIVDYSPQRGTKDVSTAAPIQITFDHDVDKASVASRFHLVPATTGTIHWINARTLSYEHSTLRPATTYEVVIEAGYSDPAGNAYVLRHHWSFITEVPPRFAASSPADGARGIDPADYLTVDFSRAMDVVSLKSAITLSPSVPFSVRLDADPRRAVVAPDALLTPNTRYDLVVTTGATDVDGNQLDRVRTVSFITGDVRPLHHWVAFATQSAAGFTGGLWIVNESGFPRQLLGLSALQAYSWSPEGDRLLVKGEGGQWVTFMPGQGSRALDFTASWAAALASGLGYVYLDSDGALHREPIDSASFVIATSVAEVAVSPDGKRLAFTEPLTGSTNIWGYDVGLKSRYLLASDTGTVNDPSWAPTGNRIAYLRVDSGGTALRIRSLTGAAATTTAASGDLGSAVWLRDSDHIVLAATVQAASGPVRKAFLINVAAPPPALVVGLGLPADPGISVSDPVPSPDGHQIAFISADQVWIMNADGTRPTALTRFDTESFPYSCLMPAWTRA
jgi:WD40 repeat protein